MCFCMYEEWEECSAIFHKLRVEQPQTGQMQLWYKTKEKVEWRACLTYSQTLQDPDAGRADCINESL